MTASGYRHGTDRQETVVIHACPFGCKKLDIEVSGDPDAIDQLVETATDIWDECPDCGAPLGTLRRDQPKEVLD